MTRVLQGNTKSTLTNLIQKLIFIRPMLVFGAVVTIVVTAAFFSAKTFVLVVLAIIFLIICNYKQNRLYSLIYLLAVFLALLSLFNLNKKVDIAQSLTDNSYTINARTIKLNGKSYYYSRDIENMRLFEPTNYNLDFCDDASVRLSFRCEDYRLDYKHTIFSKGIIYRGSVTSTELLDSKVKSMLCDIEYKKTEIIEKMYINESSEHIGSLVGMIFSDRRFLSNFDDNIMKKTGLYHLLSVSGLHVSISFMLILLIFRKVKYKWIRIILSIPLGIVMIIMSRYSPSAIRATGIIILNNIALCFNREGDGLNFLGFVVGAYLLLNPLAIKHLSFLMTVTIYMGIVIFYRPVKTNIFSIFAVRKRLVHSKTFNKIIEGLSISVVAFISIAPFYILVFHNFTFVGYLVSFLVVPLMPFVLILGYLGTLFYFFSQDSLGKLFTHLATYIVKLIISIAEIFTRKDSLFITTIYRKNLFYALLFIFSTVLLFLVFSKIKFRSPYLKFNIYIILLITYTLFFTFGVDVSGKYIILSESTNSFIIDDNKNLCVVNNSYNLDGYYADKQLADSLNGRIHSILTENDNVTELRRIKRIWHVGEKQITPFEGLIKNKPRFSSDLYNFKRISDNVILIYNSHLKLAYVYGDYHKDTDRLKTLIENRSCDMVITDNSHILILNDAKSYTLLGKKIIQLK